MAARAGPSSCRRDDANARWYRPTSRSGSLPVPMGASCSRLSVVVLASISALARTRISEDAFASAWNEGRTVSLDRLLSVALAPRA